MKELKLFITAVIITLFINACGSDDPFSVDFSSAPEPFPIESSQRVENPSGLIYYVVEEGTSIDTVTRRSPIFVFYTGRTMNGKIFDSSYINGAQTPKQIGDLGAHVPGFREGVIGMREGEKRVLFVPPHLGYGNSETHELRNDTLRFDIELDEIGY